MTKRVKLFINPVNFSFPRSPKNIHSSLLASCIYRTRVYHKEKCVQIASFIFFMHLHVRGSKPKLFLAKQ